MTPPRRLGLGLVIFSVTAGGPTTVWAQAGTPPATAPPASQLAAPAVTSETIADATQEPRAAQAPVDKPAAELAHSPDGKPEKLETRTILTSYKENYVVGGVSSQTQVKFQISLKLDLWPNDSRHSVYFGFTQKSLWNLYSSSSPFLDSNYNPEIFYGYFKRYGDVFWRRNRVSWFIESMRAGVEHESNGRDGTDSRSWNRAYGHLSGGAYFGTDHYATLGGRIWYPFLVASENGDITNFLGYGRATAVYGYDPAHPTWKGGGHVSASYTRGQGADVTRHGLEVAVQWRPAYRSRTTWWRFTPYFYGQLYVGYGEYLLDYNQQKTAIRFGVAFEDSVPWTTRR